MKNLQCWIFTILFLLLLLPNSVSAVGCKDLDSNEKIQAFMKGAYESNPLLRKNVSFTLTLDTCEGKVCRSKSKRAAQKEILRIQKFENKRRIFAKKGPNAPRCVIQRGGRRFVCSSCGVVANENCRSFPADGSTIFPGTNIDSADFSLTSGAVKEMTCTKLKNPKFFKIDTLTKTKSGGNKSGYDRVLSYYDKSKGVPITVNFFADKVLRKVYRFFPKYYVKVGDKWISTVMRVRTTNGSEKKFVFETLTHINKKNGKLNLYLDLIDDPELKNVSPESLFSTD
ncbi:MAG: hypothetical protein H8E38_02745 [SAR324 cluster bacterium]|nr:hypothetical protein [SAR324 cluster bacterium]MBL7035833.1 hypothetical protein [SAR324 cluster bacterium]